MSKAEPVSRPSPVKVPYYAALLRPTGERLLLEKNRVKAIFCAWQDLNKVGPEGQIPKIGIWVELTNSLQNRGLLGDLTLPQVQQNLMSMRSKVGTVALRRIRYVPLQPIPNDSIESFRVTEIILFTKVELRSLLGPICGVVCRLRNRRP